MNINIDEVSQILREKLTESSWNIPLKAFLVSEEFTKIIQALENEVSDERRFTPPLKNVFKAFEKTSFPNVKVIMLGMDPYPKLHAADGLAFSCGSLRKPEKSLNYMFKEIAKTVYNDNMSIDDMDPDLRRWAAQGVFLLNTALTTEVGKTGKHFHIWNSFTRYVIDMLNHNGNYVWVFLGKNAQEYAKMVDSQKHVKIFASHPASAAYSGSKEWDSNDVFNKINEGLEGIKKTPVVW